MICYPNVKINLGLNVLSKRPDGFHNLETLFVPYPGITDTLEVIAGDDYSRTLASLRERYTSLSQAISEDGKLMITLARQYDLPPMKIYLEKRAPVGAGLGGGSADAAFALKAIAQLAGLALTDDELAGYAARLGSDCAFFIYNRPMFGSGRGEVLAPFDLDLSAYKIEVVIPEGIAVSTADAYRGIVPRQPEVPLKDVLCQPVASWKQSLKNDFEETVFARYPALASYKEALYARGATYAAMSGSGSALFGLFAQ